MKAFLAVLLCLPLWAHAGCATWTKNPCIATPIVTAKSYVVMDMAGTVIKAENPDEVRSIASITKLITISRAAQAAADEAITITREDIKDGQMRSTPLRAGESYTRAQLMELALVSSDNVAAIALGRTTPPTIANGLPPNTKIVEASGLNPENQSTAREIAELARSLANTDLAAMSVRINAEIGKRHSTNPLLGKYGWTFWLSKTGFINAAGGCLVVITKVKDQQLVIAMLGSKDTHQRWRDLYELRKELDDTDFSAPNWNKPGKSKKRRAHP